MPKKLRPSGATAVPRPASSLDFGPAVLIRIFHLHQRLCHGRPVTAKALAAELEVSGRTIRRTKDLMLDELGCPIHWDSRAGTYCYTRPCDVLPLVRLTPAEALSLAFYAHLFAFGEGPPLGGDLLSGLEKLTPLIGGAVSFPLARLREALAAPRGATGVEFRHIETLLHAILDRRVLSLTYQSAKGDAARARPVHPLTLAPVDHCWMLFAFDPDRAKVVTYRLLRIHDAQATSARFTPPRDWNPARRLRGSIGRFTGEQEYEVRLAFSAIVSPYAREQRWPEVQPPFLRSDGRYEFTLRLNNLVDIKNTILRYGEHAEVLSPRELREQVRDSHKTALARYE